MSSQDDKLKAFVTKTIGQIDQNEVVAMVCMGYQGRGGKLRFLQFSRDRISLLLTTLERVKQRIISTRYPSDGGETQTKDLLHR